MSGHTAQCVGSLSVGLCQYEEKKQARPSSTGELACCRGRGLQGGTETETVRPQSPSTG